MNTTAAATGHIPLTNADLARITTTARRDGYSPTDPAQMALFDLPTRTVVCPLRSVDTTLRIGAVISRAKSGSDLPLLVG